MYLTLSAVFNSVVTSKQDSDVSSRTHPRKSLSKQVCDLTKLLWFSYFGFCQKVLGFVKKEKKNTLHLKPLKNIFWLKKTCYKPSENSSSKWLQTRVWKTSLAQSTSCKISLLWLDKILGWNCPRSLSLEDRVLANQVFWKASLESKFCIQFLKSRFKMMGISKTKLFFFKDFLLSPY